MVGLSVLRGEDPLLCDGAEPQNIREHHRMEQ